MARHNLEDSVGYVKSSTINPATEVIVRAWDDKPIRLHLERVAGSHIIVKNALTGSVVGFPRERVYLFDPGVFDCLRKAFDNGLKDELSAIWLTVGSV